jgi:hypothetical protein
MPLFQFGDPPYGVEDSKLALNQGDGTFGTNYDVPSVQLLRGSLTIEQAELTGDDKTTAVAGKIIKGEGALRFGGLPFEILSAITGGQIASSGAGSDAYRFVDFSNRNLPEWGLCGRADAGQGSGDSHLFMPRCKITSGFEIKFEEKAFAIPEVSITMLADDNFLDKDGNAIVMRLIQHAAKKKATLPPTY